MSWYWFILLLFNPKNRRNDGILVDLRYFLAAFYFHLIASTS